MLGMRSVARATARIGAKVPSSAISISLANKATFAPRTSVQSRITMTRVSGISSVSPLISASAAMTFSEITRIEACTFSSAAPAAPVASPAEPAAAVTAPAAAAETPKPVGWRKIAQTFGILSPKQLVNDPAKTGFNRWLIVPAALGTHLSLGSIFAWSLFNQPLMTLHGVVAPAAADWELGAVVPVFSTTMVCFGMSSFILGRLGVFEKLGPRASGLLGGTLFGSAFGLASVASAAHSLPLLFGGYGMLAGLAVGTAYVNPISTLLKWFPDRKGVAAAMAVMGFGGGGMVAAPVIESLLTNFRKIPTYLGKMGDVATVSKDGRLYVDITTLPDTLAASISSAPGVGTLREVVVASTSQLAKLSAEAAATLQEGLYVVGTGSTGLSETFACLGGLYSAVILASAFVFRLPPEGFNPALKALATATANAAAAPAAAAGAAAPAGPTPTAAPVPVKPAYDHVAVGGNVTPAQTLKTIQFWLVWSGMCLNSAGAYAIIGAGKTMLSDIFSGAYPTLVTSAFAATFVSMISAFNLGGRLGWGTIADSIGTRRTFLIMWGLGVPLYLAMPASAHLLQDMLPAIGALTDASSLVDRAAAYAPLALFYSSVMVAISTFGGSAAVSPAFMADLFGSKYVGAIHGQLLSFLVVAGLAGPMTCTTLRDYSFREAVRKLSAMVDPAAFEAAFGAPVAQLESLVNAKTVTIPRLMELVPVGTVDPTPFLYDNTLITMGSLQVIALAAALAVRKVDPKNFEAAMTAVKSAAQKVTGGATPAAGAAAAGAAAAGATTAPKQ
jgi:hypothetical protein